MAKRVRNPMGLTLPGWDVSNTNDIDYECSDDQSDVILAVPDCTTGLRQVSPVESNPGSARASSQDNLSAYLNIEQLQQEFSRFECTDTQKVHMNRFFTMKKAVGLLNADALDNICEIGQGSCGVVWLARSKCADVVIARKMIHLEVKQSVRIQVMREFDVLHKCNCPYIVGFYGAFISDGLISMCMEYMDAGSLDKLLTAVIRLPEHILGHVSCAVLAGLSYMREHHQYIHRDVKPSNMLVNTRGEIKLCDFSVSGKLVDSMANTFIGTRSYMSPERLDGSRYTVQSDIWSLGISLVELAIGRYPIPFPQRTYIDDVMSKNYLTARSKEMDSQATMAIFELLGYIFNADPPQLPSEYFSEPFCKFINTCLRKNASERTDLRSLQAMDFSRISSEREQYQDVADWVGKVLALSN